jgi:hypothetical protein
MPSTLHFLATLFSKILLEKQTAPDSMVWSKNKVGFQGRRQTFTRKFPAYHWHQLSAGYFTRLSPYVRLNGSLWTTISSTPASKKVFWSVSMAHFLCISYRPQCPSTWPTPCYIWPSWTWKMPSALADPGCAITLQTTTRGDFLHH